jgi:pyroglutamyl-peptidase
MNVLWTGFEPFGEHAYNPSWTVAQAAARRSEGRARQLPVTYGTRVEADGWPDLMCHLGLGASRSRICLERVATNHAGERPDNDGVVHEGPIEEEGPNRRTTALDTDRLLDVLAPRLKASKLPAPRISDDCGDYVCNALYYTQLGHSDVPAMFIHVPNLDRSEARRLGAILGSVMTGDVARSIRPEPAGPR